MKPMAVLKNYFGYKPGQTIQGFAAEVRQLSAEEKAELVALAAAELGVTVDAEA